MGNQTEITKKCDLLDSKGVLVQPGWARKEYWRYNRENIKAPWFRKKEWDYYLINNDQFALAFTISDLGYIGLLSASFIDFTTKTEHTESELDVFPRGRKYGLGSTTEDGHAECQTKRLHMTFNKSGMKRTISCRFDHFDGEKSLEADIELTEYDMESIFIATPWKEKKTAFYYNDKHNCMTAKGHVKYGVAEYELTDDSNYASLDWGRGVWTYDNVWYWGTGSGRVGNELFGMNLGYGFSDRSSASENGLYYKGKIHKLDEVEMRVPKDQEGKPLYEQTWIITSNDGRLEGRMEPIIDRNANLNYKLIVSEQHQVFGRFSGVAIMDDGERLEIKDFICAMEVVHNRY